MSEKKEENANSINDIIIRSLGKKVEILLSCGSTVSGVVEEIAYFDQTSAPRLLTINGTDGYFYYIDAIRIAVISSYNKRL